MDKIKTVTDMAGTTHWWREGGPRRKRTWYLACHSPYAIRGRWRSVAGRPSDVTCEACRNSAGFATLKETADA